MGYAHGIKWNEKLIKDGVLKCKECLGLDRMPTKSEIESFFGDTRLANKISKREGGWRKIAVDLQFEFKESETTKGWEYENKAEAILISKGYNVKKMATKEHFDLLINDTVKVDIKVGKRWLLDEKYKCNSFGINKIYATCDIYMIFALDENDRVERVLIIPSNKVKCKTTMTIGEKSIYDKWIDRYDVIDKYIELFNKF